MNRFLVRIIIAGLLVIGGSGSAAADWKLDIGYTALQNELGAALPTGAGVKVTQVEASYGKPDPGIAEFAGKTFTLNSPSLSISSHATGVGQYFYGNSSSLAPGLPISPAMTQQLGDIVSSKWVPASPWSPAAGWRTTAMYSSSTSTTNVPYLGRLDWVVNRDEYIQVVAMNNGGTNFP